MRVPLRQTTRKIRFSFVDNDQYEAIGVMRTLLGLFQVTSNPALADLTFS